MNICFFLGGFHQNGGIGRVTAMLANDLAELSDYNVGTLCYYKTGMPNIYDLSSKIKQGYFLQTYSSMARTILLGGVAHLKRFLKKNNIDILIACGALYYPISVLACRGIKTKCICWEHSDPEGNNDHRGQYIARRFGIKHSDVNIVLTKRAQKVFVDKYGVKNTVQIYNPVDEDVFKNAREYDLTSRKIISVGRLTYQKNFQTAVKVAGKLLKKYPDWQWDIYGQGEDETELRSLTQKEGIGDRLFFRGQVTDLYRRYGDYSFMVMTSRYEGFPMTLLEGIGNALPLVSFDVPTGPSEIIDDGKNGFLIPEGNTKKMTECIEKLINDPELRLNMSRAAKQKSLNYLSDRIIEQWDGLLQKVYAGDPI